MSGSGKHTVFIQGEMVNLCVPTVEDIDDGWVRWLNDPVTTRYLSFGVYPHYRDSQEEFLEGLRNKERFAVMIRDRSTDKLLGTISLSSIDMIGRSAQISLVVGESVSPKKLIPLEAMALITKHAFEVMGLDRVWAGQPIPGLKGWNHMLELLGYRTEGCLRRGFSKGRLFSDSVFISCLHEDYAELVNIRNGMFWPGNDRMLNLLKKLPKKSLSEILSESILKQQNRYFDEIINMEKNN